MAERLTERTTQLMELFDDLAVREKVVALFEEDAALPGPPTEEGLERVRFAVIKLALQGEEEFRAAARLLRSDVRDLLVSADFANNAKAHEAWARSLIGDEAFSESVSEDTVGLHVLSDYGGTHRFVTDTPTEAVIVDTIHGLDWAGFHQVFIVRSDGRSLEVGGSLDPEDGLSAMYGPDKTFPAEPPKTAEDMIRLLSSFALA